MKLSITNKFFQESIGNLLFLNPFLMLLLCLIVFSPLTATAQQLAATPEQGLVVNSGIGRAQQIQVTPEEIKITVSENELNKIRDTTIYLVSPSNKSDVKALSTDLKSDQENWIEQSKIKINPEIINLSSMQIANLTLNFDHLDSKPGIYSGYIFLTSPQLTTAIKIPLTVTIHSDAMLALFLVGLGLGTAFLFEFLKLKVKAKEESEKSINAVITKHNEARLSKNLIQGTQFLNYNESIAQAADTKINKAIAEHNQGLFRESIKSANEANNLLGNILLQGQQPPPQNPITTTNISQVHKWRWFITRPVKGDYAAYAAITLGLLISLLLLWDQYFKQLSTFGVFPIDYIAAFLFGFGTQAISLNQIMDFTKRIGN